MIHSKDNRGYTKIPPGFNDEKPSGIAVKFFFSRPPRGAEELYTLVASYLYFTNERTGRLPPRGLASHVMV